MKRVGVGLALLLLATMGSSSAEELQKLSIVIFGAPSLGAFLPPVIKAEKLDEKHGLSISFEERPPDAYTAQFNSGEFQLGGSASLLRRSAEMDDEQREAERECRKRRELAAPTRPGRRVRSARNVSRVRRVRRRAAGDVGRRNLLGRNDPAIAES